MNSRMFSIGMFPYACLGTMWVFCRPDSPKTLIKKLPKLLQSLFNVSPATEKSSNVNGKFIFVCLYAAIQLVLPYSHSITQGYNGWTQGAYGYSWDMMIHSFRQAWFKPDLHSVL